MWPRRSATCSAVRSSSSSSSSTRRSALANSLRPLVAAYVEPMPSPSGRARGCVPLGTSARPATVRRRAACAVQDRDRGDGDGDSGGRRRQRTSHEARATTESIAATSVSANDALEATASCPASTVNSRTSGSSAARWRWRPPAPSNRASSRRRGGHRDLREPRRRIGSVRARRRPRGPRAVRARRLLDRPRPSRRGGAA